MDKLSGLIDTCLMQQGQLSIPLFTLNLFYTTSYRHHKSGCICYHFQTSVMGSEGHRSSPTAQQLAADELLIGGTLTFCLIHIYYPTPKTQFIIRFHPVVLPTTFLVYSLHHHGVLQSLEFILCHRLAAGLVNSQFIFLIVDFQGLNPCAQGQFGSWYAYPA